MDDRLYLNKGLKTVKIITKKGSILEVEDIDSVEIIFNDFDEDERSDN